MSKPDATILKCIRRYPRVYTFVLGEILHSNSGTHTPPLERRPCQCQAFKKLLSCLGPHPSVLLKLRKPP